MWTAAIDPRVLAVRALKPTDGHARWFDGQSADVRMVRGPRCEHLAIDQDRGIIRLDVIDGTVVAGPVTLRFDLADDGDIDIRLATIRLFRTPASAGRAHRRLANRLNALHAVNARHGGASLRELANILLGPGAWPGEGEHRKSSVRRLLAVGSRMIAAGPRAILRGTDPA